MPTPLHEAKAELFHALAHPVRVRVLELLVSGPRTVRELLDDIGTEPSRLSQQLAILRGAELVSSRRSGGTVVYVLVAPEIAQLMKSARSILATVLSEREIRIEKVRALNAAE